MRVFIRYKIRECPPAARDRLECFIKGLITLDDREKIRAILGGLEGSFPLESGAVSFTLYGVGGDDELETLTWYNYE